MSLRLSSNTIIESQAFLKTSLSLSPVYNENNLLSRVIVNNHENLPAAVNFKWNRLRNEKLTLLKDQSSQ